MVIRFLGTLLLIFAFAGCRKESTIDVDPLPPVDQPALVIELNHRFGNQSLSFDSIYTLTNGESIRINTFKYYFTNIELKKSDSSWLQITNTYFLIDHSKPATRRIEIRPPAGSYYGIRFMIGVDSARNVSGVQEGALDPALGMFWTWVSGYIQAKMEGIVFDAPSSTKEFIHHVGGFSGRYNAVQTVTLAFTDSLIINNTSSPQISLKADAEKWFTGSEFVSPSQYSVVIDPGVEGKKISENYRYMFGSYTITP
jgi:hypothetical protein